MGTPPTIADRDSKPVSELERQNRMLIRAYDRLSQRLERADPQGWSNEIGLGALQRRLGEHGPQIEEVLAAGVGAVREVSAVRKTKQDRVRIGIASMPGREKGLAEVLGILRPQADEIFVYLNDMTRVPDSLPSMDNVRYFIGPDYGDRGKFYFLDGFDGYYITCDDDIAYASYHVQSIVDGIERYGRRAIVGWHGSIFSSDFEQFYNSKHRHVLSFRFRRGHDTGVHLLGTGACGFHTETLRLRFDDFALPNMADVFLAVESQKQEVPMIVVAHEGNAARPISVASESISDVSLAKVSGPAKFDVAESSSRIVKKMAPWKIHPAEVVYERKQVRFAIIGRTDRKRWKKGGILKSCHLTAQALSRFQSEVRLEDIETGDPKGLHGFDPEIVIIYVGDPERPDFSRVESVVEHHALKGRTVVINLSVNGKSPRYEVIANKMLAWETQYPGLIRLLVFTETVKSLPETSAIAHLTVSVPKTLDFPSQSVASFANSSGIFLGDIAKLSDESLLGGPASKWIEAIREVLPGVPLYGVRQYQPKYQVDLDLDEVWPFMTGDFVERISKMRLMVTPVKYATFEMVPVEVAALGVPVVYRNMPQSLSEYLGLAGMAVDGPEDLRDILPLLYNDPIVWLSQSRAGASRAASSELNMAAGQMYVRLVSLRHQSLRSQKASVGRFVS